MAEIKRFSEISSEEEYRKAYGIVKTLTDFNGFFCGSCKHKIQPFDEWGNFSKFCSNCGIELNEMADVPAEIYECEHCGVNGSKAKFHSKRTFCERCGNKLVRREDPNPDEPFAMKNTSFYDKYEIQF